MNPPGDEPVKADPPKPVANADDVDRRLRLATRRGFATAGVSLVAGLGAWR